MKKFDHHIDGKPITHRTDRIKVDGHFGTWYVIDETENPKTFEPIFLLEHEVYGDEAAHIVVNESGNVLCHETYNGFDDYFDDLDCE